jgi:hypothetical protein
MKRTALVLVLVAALLVAGTVPAAMQSSGTMSTAFAVQNLGDASATVTASFYQANGTHTTDLTETVDVGANFNFDQRYDSGNPGAEPFQGSAIVSADQPIGAAANIVRTGGVVPAYESYNALSTDAIGMDLLLPQILKSVPSGGLIYNTTIVIQNTDTANPADVDVVFNPDPTLNALVGGTLTEAYTHSVTIPAGGAAYIDQATTPNDVQIGAHFFGSARVLADRDVAPVVYNDGGGQVLFALPSYAGGSTDAIFMPSVYKEISSLGDNYSTAFLIVNFGDADAVVEIEYLPIVGTVGAVDTVTVTAKAALNVDQRYVAGITSASFFGAAVIQSTNSQPIAAMVNLRGGTRYGMTYGGLMAGSTTAAYIPIAYKDVASGGYSWSSTIVVQNMGAGDAELQFTFYPSGAAAIADAATYTVTAAEGVKQFDLRYTTAIGAGGANEQALFIGAVKVEAVSGTIGVMLQTRGGGGTGDALMAFQALNP